MANGFPALQIVLAANAVILLANDLLSLLSTTPAYGIYDNSNALVVEPDNIVGLDYKRDWRLSDYPVEAGGFLGYNKVQQPADARVRMTVGGPTFSFLGTGSVARQNKVLKTLEDVAGKLILYNVVTPQFVYPNMNISHFEYRRSATNGVGLLTIDVWLQEVRQVFPGNTSTTAKPSGASAQASGFVQGSDADPVTTATIQGAYQ